MNKIYEVVHVYDVDGGFGDAIGKYPKWKQRKSSYEGVDMIWGIED